MIQCEAVSCFSVAMDQDSLTANVANAPRKVKFLPKGPPRREKKLILPKPEKREDDIDSDTAQGLLQRLNEDALKVRPKSEMKGPTRVAFGQGSSASRSYGHFKVETKHEGSSSDGVGTEQRVEKEYKEPWDYYSSYPVTLPMRRPYSGNPELLDEEEFGEASRSLTYDEQSLNPAIQLGLTGKSSEESLIFFQLPTNMPIPKQSVTQDANQTDEKLKISKDSVPHRNSFHLNELPAGFMGKMLVYKSGAVKLKLGDTLYDVSSGLNSNFAQDVAGINTKDKHCCIVGELSKRAIVTPDIDSILDGISDS
ncbi:DNA-directed RNA polymerase [Lithospermum erythrorhizon]|uniref:DNA-directed RNA polymerase n=1 Tax=Lithospermum erythrorhizon TaxID=34254 RepID=A0AAV3PAS7_LITER